MTFLLDKNDHRQSSVSTLSLTARDGLCKRRRCSYKSLPRGFSKHLFVFVTYTRRYTLARGAHQKTLYIRGVSAISTHSSAHVELCMYGHHLYQSMDQTCKVAKSCSWSAEQGIPCPRSRLRICCRETGLAVLSRVGLTDSARCSDHPCVNFHAILRVFTRGLGSRWMVIWDSLSKETV